MGGSLESVSSFCPKCVFQIIIQNKRKHIDSGKRFSLIALCPQLTEHAIVTIYDEKHLPQVTFCKWTFLWGVSKSRWTVSSWEGMFLRGLVSLYRRESFCLVWFLWPSPSPPASKLREHHKGLLFSGILKFSIHASKQFRGRKSFLVVQSWTGKLEASVKI